MVAKYLADEMRALSYVIRRIAGGALSAYAGVKADELALKRAADLLFGTAERIEADDRAVPVEPRIIATLREGAVVRNVTFTGEGGAVIEFRPEGYDPDISGIFAGAAADFSTHPHSPDVAVAQTLADFVTAPDAERVQIGQQVAERVDEMMGDSPDAADSWRVGELLAYLDSQAQHPTDQFGNGANKPNPTLKAWYAKQAAIVRALAAQGQGDPLSADAWRDAAADVLGKSSNLYRMLCEQAKDYAQKTAPPASPVGVPNYTCAMGVAAQRYFTNLGYTLDTPTAFRWKDLWAAMIAAAPSATPAGVPDVAAMVNRFLGWNLPTDFAPDAGISYNPAVNINQATGEPYPNTPSGTNLFTAAQAEVMFRYVLAAAPSATPEVKS